MPSEHIKSSAEQVEKIAEGLDSARAQKLAELRETSSEHDPQAHAEKRAEQARETIEHQNLEPEPAKASEDEATPASRIHHVLNQHLNYSQTLASVQRKLSPLSRSFSHVVHTPIVEKTSEVLESTVARPSVLLGTTWTALIVGTIFYLTARHYGYTLSGSELLFSFVVGALLGLTLEGAWRALKRR
jgi:hypothetical protein